MDKPTEWMVGCVMSMPQIAVMADVSWLRDCQVWLGIDGDQHSSRGEAPLGEAWLILALLIALVLEALSPQAGLWGSDLIGLEEKVLPHMSWNLPSHSLSLSQPQIFQSHLL